MKKCLWLIAFAGIFTLGYCQDVKVNINNQEATTKEECPYRINGICSSEDIGGVDVEIVSDDSFYYEKKVYAVFTNYNEYVVNILYQIGFSAYSTCADDTHTSDGSTGSIVLRSNDTKKILLSTSQCKYVNDYYIKGMIVRKLK